MKRLLPLILLLVALTVQAQNGTPQAGAMERIGYFSYSAALDSMPQIAAVKEQVRLLREQYDKEMKRSSEEFNLRYEEFLEQQGTLTPLIMKKRQAELQDFLQRNIAFKEEAKRLLQEAEADLMRPVRERLQAAIKAVGEREALFLIVNTDSEAAPFLNPLFSRDITREILQEAR